jgi:DNA-directed RNA polymerase specialized sigma24 family protein
MTHLFLDGEGDWDPSTQTAKSYLIQAMDHAWAAEKQARKRRRTDLDTEAVEEAAPVSDPTGEQGFLDREAATRARDQLLARLEGSPLAQRVVRLCMEEGEMTSGEIAERLGEKVSRVYEAQRRIKTEIDRLRAALAKKGDGERR